MFSNLASFRALTILVVVSAGLPPIMSFVTFTLATRLALPCASLKVKVSTSPSLTSRLAAVPSNSWVKPPFSIFLAAAFAVPNV